MNQSDHPFSMKQGGLLKKDKKLDKSPTSSTSSDSDKEPLDQLCSSLASLCQRLSRCAQLVSDCMSFSKCGTRELPQDAPAAAVAFQPNAADHQGGKEFCIPYSQM